MATRPPAGVVPGRSGRPSQRSPAVRGSWAISTAVRGAPSSLVVEIAMSRSRAPGRMWLSWNSQRRTACGSTACMAADSPNVACRDDASGGVRCGKTMTPAPSTACASAVIAAVAEVCPVTAARRFCSSLMVAWPSLMSAAAGRAGSGSAEGKAYPAAVIRALTTSVAAGALAGAACSAVTALCMVAVSASRPATRPATRLASSVRSTDPVAGVLSGRAKSLRSSGRALPMRERTARAAVSRSGKVTEPGGSGAAL